MTISNRTIKGIRDFFEDNGCQTFLTGSYALGYNGKDSDVDLFVLAENKEEAQDVIIEYDEQVSYVIVGGSIEVESLEDIDTASYYSHDRCLNIILCWNKEVASRWETATELAKAFELESKPHRIACFQMMKAGGTRVERMLGISF